MGPRMHALPATRPTQKLAVSVSCLIRSGVALWDADSDQEESFALRMNGSFALLADTH